LTGRISPVCDRVKVSICKTVKLLKFQFGTAAGERESTVASNPVNAILQKFINLPNQKFSKYELTFLMDNF
jgi:hypothetical protein